jgi:hypothetical protein
MSLPGTTSWTTRAVLERRLRPRPLPETSEQAVESVSGV